MHEFKTKHPPALAPNDWISQSRIRALVLISATAVGLYLCYLLALPFLPALTLAMTLAVLFLPFHCWLEAKLKHPNLAAGVSVLAVGLILAVPATFVAQRLLLESAKGAELIKQKVESGEWRRGVEALPRIAPLVGWIERRFNLSETAGSLSTWLTSAAGSIFKESVVYAIGFCLTFYLLFYFLRDRQQGLQALQSLLLLTDEERNRLFGRIADTIHATIYGTLAVAVVQGALGGLMFWWLGLPAPLFWGTVMALLAVLPVFGAFVIWIPAALFLALEGSWEKALVLTVWGGVVVGGIDNLLQPILIGNRLKLHTILAFISVVGGLVLFGASGLILGPVVLTITMVLLETWRHRSTAGAVQGESSERSPLQDENPLPVAGLNNKANEHHHATTA